MNSVRSKNEQRSQAKPRGSEAVGPNRSHDETGGVAPVDETAGRARKRRRRQCGAALLEFAVVLPIVIFLAMGIVDLGRAVMIYNTLAHATREGTRYASVRSIKSNDPATLSKIASRVRAQSVNLNPDEVGVTAVWSPSNAPGAVVRIDTSYPFEPVTPFIPVGTLTITSRSQTTITY